MEEQIGVNFDVRTEDILTISNNEGTGTKSEAIEHTLERVKTARALHSEPRSNVFVGRYSSPKLVKALTSREGIAVTSTQCLMGVSSRSAFVTFCCMLWLDDSNEAKIFVGDAYLADLIENEFITHLRSLFINKCPLMTKLGVSGCRNR